MAVRSSLGMARARCSTGASKCPALVLVSSTATYDALQPFVGEPSSATVESVQWIGEQAVKVIFRDGEGQLSERLLYRDDEPSLGLADSLFQRGR